MSLKPGPPPVLTEEELHEAKMLRDRGTTYAKLAAIYGVSVRTIHQYLNNPDKKGRINVINATND